MSTKQVVQDFLQFEDSKIIEDSDKFLVVKAVIASEIVQPYRNEHTGKMENAYKPADELEAATWTAEDVRIKSLSHPKGNDVDVKADIHGKVRNPHFRKDLMDPKTKRPCRRGIEADLYFYKEHAPKDVLDSIRKNQLRDCSIGFTCDKDPTSGDFQGQHYDYVQRNITINHLAAPIPTGRCPSPLCGINVDSADEPMFVEVKDADLGISYHFDAAKYTPEKAKEWVDKRAVKDCPVCTRMEQVGYLTAAQRLYKQYGADLLEVIEGHPISIATQDDKPKKPDEYKSIPDDEFADPENYKYPIDAEHVAAAWSYINQDKNQGDYSAAKWADMKAKVKAAMKKHGHETAPPQDSTDDLIAKNKALVSKLNFLFP